MVNLENLDSFIEKFAGVSENYWFYNHTEQVLYDKTNHKYLLVLPDGTFEELISGSQVGKIIDRSERLLPWGSKVMGQKLLALSVPHKQSVRYLGEQEVPGYLFSEEEFEKLITQAKSAHRDHLDDAGKVGNIAHNYVESYIKAVLTDDLILVNQLLANPPAEPRAAKCVSAALEWMNRHRVEWISTEKKVYSRQYRFAGTLDGLAYVSSCDDPHCCPVTFTDVLSIVDWKSSNSLHIEYLLQTAAYQQAEREETGLDITDRFIIRLGKDEGEFDPWHLTWKDFEPDLRAFLRAMGLTKDVEELEERMKYVYNTKSAAKKEAAKLEREAALKIACGNADKYMGIKAPGCNGGNPCESCLKKYALVQAEKVAKKEATKAEKLAARAEKKEAKLIAKIEKAAAKVINKTLKDTYVELNAQKLYDIINKSSTEMENHSNE